MNRPYVIVKVAATVDGRIAIGPNLNMWEQVGDLRTKTFGEEAVWNEVEVKINALYQPEVDLLGSSSIVKEDEELAPLPPFDGDTRPLYQDFLPEEIVKRANFKGWLVVVDSRGRLRSGYTGDDNPGWHMLHLTSHRAPAEYLAFLQQKRIPYLIAGDGLVDLPLALDKMKSLLGVKNVVTTAAGKLGGALLRAGLIDEVNIIFKPQLYGGFETPALFDSPELRPDEQPANLKLLSAQSEANGHVWLRYLVERK